MDIRPPKTSRTPKTSPEPKTSRSRNSTSDILDGADFATAARRSVAHRIKMQARLYARRPMLLETLHTGLAAASPATLVAIGEHLVTRERASPRRWFGFGGEVNLINARAALLLGRTLRRDDRR